MKEILYISKNRYKEFYILRHVATSRFFELGLNVMEVSSITGHKDLKMLLLYTHLKAEDFARKLP